MYDPSKRKTHKYFKTWKLFKAKVQWNSLVELSGTQRGVLMLKLLFKPRVDRNQIASRHMVPGCWLLSPGTPCTCNQKSLAFDDISRTYLVNLFNILNKDRRQESMSHRQNLHQIPLLILQNSALCNLWVRQICDHTSKCSIYIQDQYLYIYDSILEYHQNLPSKLIWHKASFLAPPDPRAPPTFAGAEVADDLRVAAPLHLEALRFFLGDAHLRSQRLETGVPWFLAFFWFKCLTKDSCCTIYFFSCFWCVFWVVHMKRVPEMIALYKQSWAIVSWSSEPYFFCEVIQVQKRPNNR